jgi:hypothetical protein
MSALSTLSAAAVLLCALVPVASAVAAPKATQAQPEAPKENVSKLTEGECAALGGGVKTVAVSIWCLTGQRCTRVDQHGKIIDVGCVDGITR